MPVKEIDNIILFYGIDVPFSNMYRCSFTDNNNITFNCVEQYFQYYKCITFDQHIIANQILREQSPYKQKMLGGSYFNGFNVNIWNNKRFEIMFIGNMHKYTQNKILLKILLDTKDCTLAEATKESFWGIGLDIDNSNSINPNNWTGSNRMGYILKNIRYWARHSDVLHNKHELPAVCLS